MPPIIYPRPLVSFDWAMKKLLRSKANFGVLEGFLSELLKRDIKILHLLESESNQEHARDKQNRIDLVAKADGGEIILIEVQADSEYDFFQRMLYGASKVVSENLGSGEEYADVKKVYSINIIYFDLGHGKDYIYHGTTSFVGLHKQDILKLNEKQKELYHREWVHELYPEYYLLKVNNFNNVAKDTLDQWMYFLKNDEIKNNFNAKGLVQAKEALDVMKLSHNDAIRYKRYLEDLHYEASMAATYNIDKKDYEDAMAKSRAEGEAIGRAEGEAAGRAKGEAEGKVEGEKIGIERGILEGKKETARNLKQLGIDLPSIIKATGLSESEIEKL